LLFILKSDILYSGGDDLSRRENYHIKPNNYLHYKDYVGNIEFSEADGVFHGKVVGIKSLISFEGNSVNTII